MNERDIKRLVYIASRADGGCLSCASDIARELARFWPEVSWMDLIKAELDKPYEERYDDNDERIVPE